MKKIISVISAAALAAGMTTAFTVSAEDKISDYNPSFYFKAEEGKGIEVLTYGAAFVNTKKASADGAVVPCSLYIKDDQKLAGSIVAKWQCERKGLTLKGLDNPIKKYGKTPYADFNESPDDILSKEFTDMNMLSILYSTYTSADPMKLTGESTEEYPLACFEAALAKDAEFGSYDINIINKGEFTSSVSPRYKDPSIIGSVDMSEKSKTLRINVSDRMLGDINNDGYIDAVDASSILKEYAKISAKQDTSMSKEQAAAADVNGDMFIDAVDASRVLGYYAYVSSSKDSEPLSLNQYTIQKASK